MVLKLLDYPPHNHPIYAVPISALALLGFTEKIEEECEVDVKTVYCVTEGMTIEKK